ncbi:MAG: Plasmid stabilization system [Parcubacteria group bacterium GW2011_GWA1_44_13]|uniref:Plasmid stabilization system n=1 Tax=Candidatus Nomurabacteria bacterium GW2011_GWB1_44_12 TaxID=1618748 RepID=A0A837IAD1_9BACT|nr:MAG: Plasmid stabilization system [Candidatus Nomurabacteria bacterium GW2011_GWD1_44_10]KKT36576.1 MAG: Plasmid stabilization system [Candidatus Nomurabacteria bacterium GW2011_GWB1_44_12]KKT38202.1 MAG: Plasmid stabilization system [Parcubacteria group bacterium GW2011_GWA1_44_13]KKT60714.1 MAG: Plasmid stabilization system [Parcubacteria group bacterium GW2011_GWC1_44_26]HBB44240.1 hypothetical protein [Candidatus Yonathbacteria bacterium]
MFEISFDSRALKDLQTIPRQSALLLSKVLAIMEGNPFAPELRVKKLEDPLVGYRVRKGDYRILFEVVGKKVFVYAIRHRKDAYR